MDRCSALRRVRNSSRGDTSILLVFLTLSVLVLGATVISVVAVGNLRGARDVVASTQAFHAVDTGIERGLYDYHWDTNGETVPDTETCTVPPLADQPVAGQTDVTYDLTVEGRDAGGNATACPTIQEVQDGTKALCMEATGKTRGGAVRRRVTNDSYDTSKLTNPCGR